jgi:predicted dehydrogenase
MKQLGIALYGSNGHQLTGLRPDHPRARLVAVAALEPPPAHPAIRRHRALAEILADPEVDLVSLCSPRRADQAADVLRCLEAGKHVYAEKPCALTEPDLDRLIARSRQGPARFREMAGTAFEEPYLTMGEIVRAGRLGTIVQVFVQKSYPMGSGRPQDEGVVGGIITWVGVHALRLVEHVTGIRIREITALETKLGNPLPGELRAAACLTMRLENGGLAGAICNYLNQPGFGRHGNEHLRIFGTAGFVEATDGGTRTRLVIGQADLGPLACRKSAPAYEDLYFDELLGLGAMPLSLEDELHPTRMAIRAKQSADAAMPSREESGVGISF